MSVRQKSQSTWVVSNAYTLKELSNFWLNDNISNFLSITVNGWIFSTYFLRKIYRYHTSQCPFRKFENFVCWNLLSNNLWSLCCKEWKKIDILYDHIFFWVENCSVISGSWAQTSLNLFKLFKSVISDLINVSIEHSIKLSKFWHLVTWRQRQNYALPLWS